MNVHRPVRMWLCAGMAACASVAVAGEAPGFDPAEFQKQMEAMQKAMAEMARTAAPVVDHRELRNLLPESLGAMKRTSVSSERSGAMGVIVAKADARYEGKDDAFCTVTLTDTAGLGAMGAMAQMGMAGMEIDRENDEGYERSVTVKGFRGVETYDKASKSGELRLSVARFMVEIKAGNAEPAALRAAAEAMDLKKLSELKGAPAKD